MKYLTFVFLVATILLTGCMNTKLIRSWENKEQTPKQYSNVGIAALTPNNSSRYILERAITDKLKEDGLKVMPTYDAMPFAGRIGELKGDKDSEAIRRMVKEKMVEHKIDALMVLALFNKETEERWVNNHNYHPGGVGYYGSPMGHYGSSMRYSGRYYDYYSYSIGTLYNSGYYTEDVTYYIECNLYDVASEEMLWSGQISVKNMESLDKEAEVMAYIIAKELKGKKVVTP